jgi:integrase
MEKAYQRRAAGGSERMLRPPRLSNIERTKVVARETGNLKSKQVDKLIRAGEPGAHYDGRGLRLEIKGPHSAYWISRYQLNGVIRYMGLGSAFDFGLEEARTRNRRLVRQPLADGIDPLLTKRTARAAAKAEAAKAVTFDEACRRFLEQHGPKWDSPKHAKQWGSTLASYASPVIGKLPVGKIDVPLVLKVLEQPVPAERNKPAGTLWSARKETASRLRGRIEAVLDWAKGRGYRDGDNPAQWSIVKQVLPDERGDQQHHAALPYNDIPAFMTELRVEQGSAARALEFLVLVAARSQEVLKARWSEFELRAVPVITRDKDGVETEVMGPVWIVPAPRMKKRKDHRVPLAPEAVELLRALPVEDGNDFVFIGRDAGQPLGHTTLPQLLNRRMGRDVTVHGFRSSFRDWSSERTAFPDGVCEAALAHVKGKTERAYQRGDLFDKRRALMNAWSTYCSSPPAASASVTPIRGAVS